MGLVRRNIEVAPRAFWVSGNVFISLSSRQDCNAMDELLKKVSNFAQTPPSERPILLVLSLTIAPSGCREHPHSARPRFRAGRQDTKGIPLASQNNNGGQGGPWGSGRRRDSDFENLVRQGQDRLKQVLPAGGPRSTIILAIFALVGLAAWTAYYTEPSDSVAVVQRFGKYLKDVPPGLHFKLPLGIDVATIVPVKRQLKQEFWFATPVADDPNQAFSV